MAYRNLIRTEPPPGPELAARIVDDVLVAWRTPGSSPGAGSSRHRRSTP
jgi:hypothetical protein